MKRTVKIDYAHVSGIGLKVIFQGRDVTPVPVHLGTPYYRYERGTDLLVVVSPPLRSLVEACRWLADLTDEIKRLCVPSHALIEELQKLEGTVEIP